MFTPTTTEKCTCFMHTPDPGCFSGGWGRWGDQGPCTVTPSVSETHTPGMICRQPCAMVGTTRVLPCEITRSREQPCTGPGVVHCRLKRRCEIENEGRHGPHSGARQRLGSGAVGIFVNSAEEPGGGPQSPPGWI